jgi:hypothetical protein
MMAPAGPTQVPQTQRLANGSAAKLVFGNHRRAGALAQAGSLVLVMMTQNGGGPSLDRRDAKPTVAEDRAEAAKREPRRALDEARLRQQAIGVKLRQLFDEVVNEPVPDEFLDILRRHDQKAQGCDDQ